MYPEFGKGFPGGGTCESAARRGVSNALTWSCTNAGGDVVPHPWQQKWAATLPQRHPMGTTRGSRGSGLSKGMARGGRRKRYLADGNTVGGSGAANTGRWGPCWDRL